VQIAKAFGAEVTGVCSTRNVDMVRSIGADHVIDYTQEDFTQRGLTYLTAAIAAWVTLSRRSCCHCSRASRDARISRSRRMRTWLF
jgi:D-arabinose 1-dehydrogenase-like Zn-dependent alcohol dehydrogenase